MVSGPSGSAFAYHEPAIATVLNLTGFLLALNLINVCLNKFIYCGLVGQLFVGILWGSPGAKWLDSPTETIVQQLGYLGLIMLVYEGGLSTSIKSVRANLSLSICVAITGIGTPMALSFVLKDLVSASSLQSFAAGAALSATSLGTTFTILSSTDLIATRLGTVTTSAAMLDDVVGLVMVQIVSNFGGGVSSFGPLTVIRPILVSVGFALGLFLLCSFCLKPVFKKVLAAKNQLPGFTGTVQFAFFAQTCLLIGTVAGATYAGTSSLFAAYLVGVIVSWFDELVVDSNTQNISPVPSSTQPSSRTPSHQHPKPSISRGASTRNRAEQCAHMPSTASTAFQHIPDQGKGPTGEMVYQKYYREPVNRILVPFFFASIGFAIPITQMFQGRVVWRGIIYAILMVFGKLVTGLWLVRFSLRPTLNLMSRATKPFSYVYFFCASRISTKRKQKRKTTHPAKQRQSFRGHTTDPQNNNADQQDRGAIIMSPAGSPGQFELPSASENYAPNEGPSASLPPKPKSLYPPSILGLAMVARGEVGYLIASLGQSKGIFSSESSEDFGEIYLVILWAISICTLIGPISVGALVKRVKKLQRTQNDSDVNPLGIWGI
ncbi:hypothetical protein N7510_008265 [Penicillium lagena]|uniref:uncharacterized protein n=1 Tax=Penicillium lagena TaxID=94218 RepID=UPI00253FDB03|nr:uncharacterized protein N7510_008265 [Penicillium lagena]KAJ5605484.1 hypothetical protein N7510_008265 [Penicillium lagena]